MEHLGGQRREQHDGHGHEHRDDVDQVGAEQVATAHRVADALDDPGEARRRRGRTRGVGAHRREQDGGGDQTGDVDGERRRHTGGRDQHPAQGGAGQLTHVAAQAGQRHRGGQLVVAHGAGDQRLTARALQRLRHRQQRPDGVDGPQARAGQGRVDQQQRGQRHLGDAGAHQHRPTVDVVGQRPAVQPEHQQRQQLDEPHQADREARAGELVELERQRDVADHPAEVEHRAGTEQQPEVARGA